ncbi:MAG: TIGR01458 family HAD-type hydrolase [Verrucomicrobiales bacterium]|nr:TIGR01458 family HAD-type hydrolase [Verrucomicrobiales bacterium]
MPAACQAVFFDLSGVLYEGSKAVTGAAKAVDQARNRGLTIRFVTNTSTKCREDILNKLDRLGIEAEPSELFSAPMAALEYLLKHDLRPYCLVHEAIEYEFSCLDRRDPNAVLIGDARGRLHYESLNRAFQLCHAGAPLFAIGKNRYFKTEEELQLDSGAFVVGLEWAAGTEAVVLGKPGPEFFRSVVESTGFSASECLMIGDDLESDIYGAIDCGLQATLVRTGKYQPSYDSKLPDGVSVVDSVADLVL